jgi:hypothetical protein
MSILDTLAALFSGKNKTASNKPESDGRALYFYMRCNNCNEKLRIRVDTFNELMQEFDDNERTSGYTLDKDIMGNACFRMMHLHVTFDKNKRIIEQTLDKGILISKQEYLDTP